jgi:transposase
MGQRRRFTPEFKREAVQLLNAGQRPAAQIARELGLFANLPSRKAVVGLRSCPA